MNRMKDNVIILHPKKLDDISDADITKDKYRSLERRYNSIVDAAQLLLKQNNEFRSEIETSHKKLENAQLNVEINKNIVFNTITDANNKKDSYISEIAELKTKLASR